MATSRKVNTSKVNPFAPIFYLRIGDTDFTLQNSPEMGEYVISFSMNRSAEDMANDIVIRLFDRTALMIEWYILQGYKSVTFQYGMDESNLSKKFKANIKDYTISFLPSRAMVLELTLQLGELTDQHVDETSKTYKTNKPCEVVKMIAKEMGWKEGKITKTKPVTSLERFNRQGETAEDFIKQVLVPKAVSTSGQTNYTFYIDYDNTGSPCVFFLPKDESLETTDIKTYQIIIGGGDEGGTDVETVISFTPNYGGILQALASFNASSTNGLNMATPSGTGLGSSDELSPDEEIEIVDSLESNTGLIESTLNGVKVYRKKQTLSVYDGTSTTKCEVIDSLFGEQTASIMGETNAWYKVKTCNYVIGWVRKVDCSLHPPDASIDNVIQSNTDNSNSIGGSVGYRDVDIEVPTIDTLTNTLVKPYNKSSIKRRIGSSTFTDEDAGKVAEYLWTKMCALDNTAELVLRGDASFFIQAFVLVVVLTPDGYFHHSSGLYQVLEIVDDIEGGSYTTTLNLVKRTLIVNDDGSISPGQATGYMYATSQDSQGGMNTTGAGTSLEESNLRKVCDAYNGKKYSQSARTGPNSYDCSSLVNAVMGDMGISVNWSTTADCISKKGTWGTVIWESGKGQTLTADMLKSGYIGCYNQGGSGHTWIFLDETTIFHAAGKNKGVLYADLTEYYVKKLNSCNSGRAVVIAPPASSGSPVKNNNIKSSNYPDL